MSSISMRGWRFATPALSALASLICFGSVSAQSTFDPYNPSTGMYREFIKPSYPSNLGLPGQARQAYSLEREALYGTKVGATPYERFLRDGYEDIFAPSGVLSDNARGRAGVPYYRVDRGVSSAPTTSQADRDFNAIRRERDRRYFEALRETDPAKRARLLRRVNEPIDPADIPPETDQAGKNADSAAGSNFRIGRNREPAPSKLSRERDETFKALTTPKNPVARMPLAGEPLTGLPGTRPNLDLDPTKPSSLVPDLLKPRAVAAPGDSTSARPPATRRRAGGVGSERRPLLPSEVVDRNRRAAEASGRPSNSTGSAGRDNAAPKP